MATKDKDGTFGFDRLLATLDFRTRAVKVPFTKANNRIGLVFVERARAGIKGREFEANAAATIKRKGSSLPLVDGGDLFGSITYDVRGPTRVFVGINSPVLPNGRPLYDVLHSGATIRRGGNVWVIPPRPFLAVVWEDTGFLAEVKDYYRVALEESLKGAP